MSAKVSGHITSKCSTCRYYNVHKNVCYRLSVIRASESKIDDSIVDTCVENNYYEPSMKTMLGYKTVKIENNTYSNQGDE